MPLARYAVYRGGPQIWLAPTADDTRRLARHRCATSRSSPGAFVVSVPQFIPASGFPDDFPVPLPEGKEVFGSGGAAIIEPDEGEVIAGPLYGEEGMRRRRLRPARRAAREALVRRRRPLQPRGRARRPAERAAVASGRPRRLEPSSRRCRLIGRPVAGLRPVRCVLVEPFTAEEQAVLLEPHFTNLDRPVFCLVNLPETVKGALFARYSRYPGTLRRLFLEEFAADVAGGRAAVRRGRGRAGRGALRARLHRLRRRLDRPGRRRARRLRVGLERPHEGPSARPPRRLSRAVDPLHPLRPADRRAPAATATTATSELGPAYRRGDGRAVRDLLARRSRTSRPGRRSAGRAARSPRRAWRRSIRAKALDLLRGLLPASTLSHVGIYASGQAYEQLLLRLAASPLPEARDVRGDDPARSSAQVIPSFVARVEPPRPRRRVDRLPARSAARRPSARSPGSGSTAATGDRRAVGRADRRRRRRGGRCSRASLFESAGLPEAEIRRPDRRPRPDRARGADRRAGRRARATAATARAAAGRRSATGSRSSPTTAASATCSATGC